MRNRSKASKLIIFLLAAALALVALAGCGGAKDGQGNNGSGQPGPGQASGEPKQGGTLTIARPTDAVSLDPHAESTSPGNWVMSNVLETLIVMQPDGSFTPGLATDWSQPAPDKWVFNLRKGVKFHDGTDFNAAAVKFSIERIMNPDNPGRAASNLAFIKEINVINDHTLEIVTDGPYGPTLSGLALPYTGGVVSPAAVEKYGEDFGRNLVGTGPFKFVEWKTNNSITIERFDDYWGEKPYLDRIVYRVIPEESARMLALERGEVDVVMNPAPSEIEFLKKDNRFTVHEVPGVRVIYFGLNVAEEPLNDIRVRQALNYAMDRQAIVDNILEGAAVLPTSYISPGVFGYKDVSKYFTYDPDKAEQLLDEAGWVKGPDGMRSKDGQPLHLELHTPKGRYLKDSESAEVFQDQLRKIGVSLDVKVVEWGTLFSQARGSADHGLQMFTMGWSTATGDADYTLRPLFDSKSLPPGGWNSYNYANERVDELAALAAASTDQDERLRLYGEMQEILAADAPWVPVYNSKEVIVTDARVKGFTIHPIDYFLWFHKTWLDK